VQRIYSRTRDYLVLLVKKAMMKPLSVSQELKEHPQDFI